jgi:hypothetical protein
MKHTSLLAAILGATILPATADPMLTLDPVGGAITGLAGDTIGWGFTIQNSTDFILVTSVQFDAVTPLGSFTDYAGAYNFVVVGPAPESTSVSQSFDSALYTGAGAFAISPTALAGQTVAGYINFTYDLFSVSPNDPAFDPGTDLIKTDQVMSSFARVTVAVPEPTLLPLVVGALLMAARLPRRRA